jgi:hypothetical protein
MMMGTSVMEMMILLFGGGLSGIPMGMPPAAPDPVMARIAPDDSLVYVAWNGTADASPDSANNAEKMLADPQIKRFIDQLIEVVEKGVRRGAGPGANSRKVATEIPKVVRTIFTRPTTFFIGQVGVGPKGINAPLGFVVNVGENGKDFERSFKLLQDLLADESGASEKEGDTTWYSWPTLQGVPPISWGVENGYFILSVGEGTREQIQARMKGDKDSAFLAGIAKRLPVERGSSVTYINVQNIIKTVTPLMSRQVPDADNFLALLGLNEFKSVSSVTGFDKTHIVSRSWIEVSKRTGVFDVIRSKPLTAEDLASIPADATIAMAINLDVGATVEQVVDLVAKFEPRARDEFDQVVAQSEDFLGFHLMDDLAASVGDRWCVFQSPNQGGPIFTGWTAVASAKDSKKLKDIAAKIERFVSLMNARMQGQRDPRFRREVGIKTTEAEGQTIYFMNSVGEEIPVAPAWCVTETEVVFSLFPQGVVEYLKQRDTPRLADVAQVKERLASKPFSITYYDTKTVFDSVYPMALIGANFLCSEMQRNGFDIDISMLPSPSAISAYLQPSTSSMQFTDDGIELYSNRTLPVGLAAAQSLALPLMLFSVRSSSRAEAPMLGVLSPRRNREMQGKNNLKQIGLAMHNYHDTFNRFPAGGLDENGKANGLSWRVHLLPFIEQGALYQKFNLDEAWDSEHNKKLINLMPTTFKAPGSTAKPGLTNYVVLSHANGIVTGKEGKRIADILDGTSNTILAVEADDKHAVTWTKPADIDFDSKKPHTGLGKLRNGRFMALIADGSVQTISIRISAKMLNNLADRRDGNSVILPDFRKGGDVQQGDAPADDIDDVRAIDPGEAATESRAVDKAVAP